VAKAACDLRLPPLADERIQSASDVGKVADVRRSIVLTQPPGAITLINAHAKINRTAHAGWLALASAAGVGGAGLSADGGRPEASAPVI